jgi:hypothetical protein
VRAGEEDQHAGEEEHAEPGAASEQELLHQQWPQRMAQRRPQHVLDARRLGEAEAGGYSFSDVDPDTERKDGRPE